MSRKARKQPVLETHSTDELLAKARGYVPTAGNATVETLASMIAYRRLLDGDRPQDEVQMLQEAFHSLVGQECRLVVEADNGIICYRERTTGQTVGNTMHLFCLPLRPDVGDKIKLLQGLAWNMVTAAGGNPPPNVADLPVVTRSSAHEFQTLAENVHKFFKGEEHGEEAVVA